MKFYNRLDEQGRFLGLKYDLTSTAGQENTHTYSYLYCRKMYQDMGLIMGLDQPGMSDLEKKIGDFHG